jgi:hypothetical protein
MFQRAKEQNTLPVTNSVIVIIAALTFQLPCELDALHLFEQNKEIFILIPCIIDYVEINQLNALNYILLHFLLQWLLHVSAKQCHPQGATMFLSEPL